MHLKIKEVAVNRDKLAAYFLQLKKLDTSLKTSPDNIYHKPLMDSRRSIVSSIRRNIMNTDSTEYERELLLRDGRFSFIENSNCSTYDSELLTNLLISKNNALRKSRAANRLIPTKQKLNCGFQYIVEGGVFTKQGSILELFNVNHLNMLRESKRPKTNDVYVGVELELISSLSREKLEAELAKKRLGYYVQVKGDSSITPEDGYSYTHEVTLMCKLSDIKVVIPKVCDVLKATCKVNNSCGLHVHLDARQNDPTIMYHNLVLGLPAVLNPLVPKNRINNSYCKQNTTLDMAKCTDRYSAINAAAYSKYRTIEIRMHSGSINTNKIVNWVQVCALLGYHPTKLTSLSSLDEFKTSCNVSDSLIQYMIKRAADLKNVADANQDHSLVDDYNIAG